MLFCGAQERCVVFWVICAVSLLPAVSNTGITKVPGAQRSGREGLLCEPHVSPQLTTSLSAEAPWQVQGEISSHGFHPLAPNLLAGAFILSCNLLF